MSPIDGVDIDFVPPPPPLPENDPPSRPPAPVERHDSSSTVMAPEPRTPAATDDSSRERRLEDPGSESGGDGGKREFGVSASDRYFPLSTATMQTSVFDVVHIFSERGISAVPILDEDGVVLNMYETVDIVVSDCRAKTMSLLHVCSPEWPGSQDLMRQNAYQVLDSTIEVALNQRALDFTGVMTCTPRDTLASVLAYIRERRCHRFVIIEPEDVPADPKTGAQARKKGSLVGILSLSDVLRYLVGQENLKGHEVPGLGKGSRANIRFCPWL